MMHCIFFMSLDLLFCFDPLEEATFSSFPLPLLSMGRFNSHNSPTFQSLTIFHVEPAFLPWFLVPWLEMTQQTHSSPCLRTPAVLPGGPLLPSVWAEFDQWLTILMFKWAVQYCTFSWKSRYADEHLMFWGSVFWMHFVALEHFALKEYWRALKDPQRVTECCEWEGGIWMLWK